MFIDGCVASDTSHRPHHRVSDATGCNLADLRGGGFAGAGTLCSHGSDRKSDEPEEFDDGALLYCFGFNPFLLVPEDLF